MTMPASSAVAPEGPIRHIVHLKFKADADKAQVTKVIEAFGELKTKIPAVESLEWGTNISSEGYDKGFLHCWILTFKTTTDRDSYLAHPAHQAFVQLVLPVIEDAVIVDFKPQ